MNINLPAHLPKRPVAPVVQKFQASVFTLVLVLVAGWLFFQYLLNPKLKQLDTERQTKASLQEEYSQLSGNVNNLERLIAIYKDNPEAKVQIDEMLPLKADVAKFYIYMEQSAKMSGMTIGDVSTDFKADEPVAGNRVALSAPYSFERGVRTLKGSMTLKGNFDQFFGLLKKLESNARIINVKTLNVASAGDEGLEFRLDLETYYYE